MIKEEQKMSVRIKDIRVICTAPEGINLVVVKIETNQPGLYGLGCATFAYRHLTVKHLIEEYMKPLLVGRPVENIEETWQLMHQNGYWRNGPIENNAISGIDMAKDGGNAVIPAVWRKSPGRNPGLPPCRRKGHQ